jgi:hypothetical protein
MAVMIPDEIDEERKPTSSERAFYDLLRDRVSDEFYVYHSLPYLDGHTARQGEADFLVLHPHYGMLIIEVKGGGVFRDKKNGQWYRVSSRGREKLARTPMEQAADQVRTLVEKFKRPASKMFPFCEKQFPMVTGWALAFPFATREEVNLPPELEPEVVLDSSVFEDPERCIVRAMEFHARGWSNPDKVPRLKDAKDFRRFREGIVGPGVELVPTLKGKLAAERQRLIRMTEEQSYVVRIVLANKRARVLGGAGTGKTIVARQAAQLLAAEGKDVLLTCFNNNLAAFLAESVAEGPKLPGTILARHFHGLCSEAAKAISVPLNPPDDRDEQRRYWTEEAPFILAQAIEQQALGPWDAIFVDEAQDFAELWWDVLHQGLKDSAQGTIAAFYDPSQRIFSHGGVVPEYPTLLPLQHNFRNTRAISAALQQLASVDMIPHPRCMDGEPPTVIEQAGPSWTLRKLRELLDDLIARGKLTVDQIAILTPRSPKNSVLEGCTALGDYPIVHHPRNWHKGVLHTTIGKFKGLESDVIIMLDVDPDDPNCSVNARYVAASRARHRLYVFSKGNWLAT